MFRPLPERNKLCLLGPALEGDSLFVKAILLAATLAVAPAAALAATPGPMPPPANQALARQIMQDLVEVRSVHAIGTAEVAKRAAAHLAAAGFSGDDLQILADPKYPHQANVVARLRGTGKARPVLYMGHLDVVEARAEDWTVPPFELTEKDGYFYGRGTTDMKGPDAAFIASLIRLKQEGFRPERDIILILTADEEVGLEQGGAWWLVRERRALIDAAFAVDFDGSSGALDNGRRVSFEIETSQKTYVTFRLEVTNKGGHSSVPRPDNAIYTLAAGLTRLAAFQFPLKTNASTRLYFERRAKLEDGERAADMAAVARGDIEAARRLSNDVAINPILHSTCVATMLDAGHQENALPQRARATVQCRIMPDETPASAQAVLEAVLADPAIAVSIPDEVVRAGESPPTPVFMAKLDKVVGSMWPGVPVLPVMAAGASDAIFTRNGGIPTYGLSGAFEDVHDGRAHGRDERIGVPAFYESVEFAYRLMKELSKAK
jgi:acetylornithine deacetylase/succinyl-diaminopimelate desuccinylase-like protein